MAFIGTICIIIDTPPWTSLIIKPWLWPYPVLYVVYVNTGAEWQSGESGLFPVGR